MLTPSPQAVIRPFYAVGNTPATSLTRCMPQGVDADILMLGCGDVRHILYTAYAEQGFPKRKLDITACDTEEHIIARNILMLSLILDGSEATISAAQIWNIYYHTYLDEQDMHTLGLQAKKLLALSQTLQNWHQSAYGATLRFCDQETLGAVNSIWTKYTEAVAAKDTPKYTADFQSVMRKSQEYKDKVWGRSSIVYTSSRSAAPISAPIVQQLNEATERHWRTGRSSVVPSDLALFPNPMFAVAVSKNLPLAYPADPLLSFHLATAVAKLSELSPLRIRDNSGQDLRLLEAAQVQFREWANAFQRVASRTTIRFITADCFSFCHTLQHNVETRKTTAHWYRREMGFQALELAETEYSPRGQAPNTFDVIDTSNISDYNGPLNLLVSAGTLLKEAPWATLYTELMARGKVSDSKLFEALLCGHTNTVSLLLGLAPIEYWTNATAVSVVDECIMALSTTQVDPTASVKKEGLKIQCRLAWTRGKYFSASEAPTSSSLSIKPDDVATILHQVYLQMFEHENVSKFQMGSQGDRIKFMQDNSYPKYHRGSFVAFLKAVCANVQTSPSEVGRLLVERIGADRTLMLGSNHSQALCLAMSKAGLFSESWLTREIKLNNTQANFCKWRHIPEAIAVTVVIPALRWKPVCERALEQTAGLTMEANLRSVKMGVSVWHNIYSDIQVAFGTITTKNPRDDDDFTVLVREDKERWNGNSPMVVSFYTSAAALQVDIPTTKVAICLQITGQNMVVFAQMLGPTMAIFETALLDENHVFVSKHPPGQSDYPIIGSSTALPSNIGSLEIGGTSPKAVFTADVNPSTGDITSITGHIDITSETGKRLLGEKVPIKLHQASAFTINIVFGSDDLILPLSYPVPVFKDGSKTRIARKSQYVEIIAPFADPVTSSSLEDFIFPTVLTNSSYTSGTTLPATLNVPHLSLDTLPILCIDDKDRDHFLVLLATYTFSSRERRLREETIESPNSTSGLSANARLNFKESVFTMFMLASGLQGKQTGLFSITHPQRGGIHMYIFVSALRLDSANASVVLDAAILPLTLKMIANADVKTFLYILKGMVCCTLTVDDAELALWKKVLPALAERCRTWEHTSECEYRTRGAEATVPLSLEAGEQLLCSCGQGKVPKDFVALPEWEVVEQLVTRVAISPVFSSPFVESMIDTVLGQSLERQIGNKAEDGGERCLFCGRPEGDQPGGGALKKCLRCLEAKYCSPVCQKKDWKRHRSECQEADISKEM
ncbi:MYND finger [Podospora appendiculata]|uniref:MYND finger n=1 Tax=Podospora appendiculata TaxID=314037 RepID=A0AAE0XB32_9PEZI|nr:MYND finger [Podospora appendiculata]